MWIIIQSWILSTLGSWFILQYALKLGLIDIPNYRSSHSAPIPRGAGIGICLSFVFLSVSLSLPKGFWIPIFLLALVSLFDDKLNLSSKLRLFLQSIFALAVIFSQIETLETEVVFLTIFYLIFIVGTTNFYNFMDGINGIAGIAGFISFILISWFAFLLQDDNIISLFAASMAAACLGFLPFNMPRAKVFMGDVGSILLGFVFAATVVLLCRDLITFITLSSFLFPFYIDAITTIYVRWCNNEKLLLSHRKHFYQLLANELAYSHSMVSLVYGGVQLLVGIIMILAWRMNLIIVQVGLLMFFCLIFIYISMRVRQSIAVSNQLS